MTYRYSHGGQAEISLGCLLKALLVEDSGGVERSPVALFPITQIGSTSVGF